MQQDIMLPQNRPIKTLWDVIIFWPKKSQVAHIADNTPISFVPMSDLSQEQMLFEAKEIKQLGEVRKSYTYFEDNDVLLAKVTPCFENGKCGIARNLKNWVWFWSSEFFVLRTLENLLPEYLYYIVSGKRFRKEGEKNMWWAVGLQRVKKEWIENFPIPLPPLEEQKKIVAYLDELNSTITKLKAEYQSQLTALDEMRNSSLDLAFWWSREREWNLNNWKWVKLGEVCEIIGWGTPSKQNQKYYKDGKIPWATVRDMKDNIIETTEIYITQEGLENSAANIIPAYWLLIATRVWLGKVSLLTKPTAINQDLKWLLPKKRLKLHFLFWYFKSLAPYIISQGSGATVQGIKLDFLKNIQIPLPDLETQAKIVAHLDQVHQLIISLKAQISQQMQHCDELWQSSLEQALSQGVK